MSDEKKEDVKETKIPNPEGNSKKKKIILFSSIGAAAVVILALIIVLIVNLTNGKPSKKDSEKLVKNFLEAVNEKDGEAFAKLVDDKGYVIYNEEKESKFNEKYKKKDEYFKKFQKKNDLDGADEVKELIEDSFTGMITSQLGYGYSYSDYECSLKEVTDISKSKKSNKLVVIKAKVKVKSTYSTDTVTLRLYTTKVSGKYKIVGFEFVK